MWRRFLVALLALSLALPAAAAQWEQTYEVEPGGDGDAGFTQDNNIQNDPTFTSDSVSCQAPCSKYRSLFLRYELDIPKGAIVTKARLTMKTKTAPNNASGTIRIGVMVKDTLWEVDGWNETNYPDTGSTVGWPTNNANNTLIGGTLSGEAFCSGQIDYLKADFGAGDTVTIGTGYSGLTFDTLSFVGCLQTWIDSAAYTPQGSDSGATALVLHHWRAGSVAVGPVVYTDNHPTEPTITLEVGWQGPNGPGQFGCGTICASTSGSFQ